MQLSDLVKPIDQCTDEELMERLRTIRHNRNTVRPAGQARVKRAAKKGTQARVRKVESLIDGLTEAQKQQLILELTGGNA